MNQQRCIFEKVLKEAQRFFTPFAAGMLVAITLLPRPHPCGVPAIDQPLGELHAARYDQP